MTLILFNFTGHMWSNSACAAVCSCNWASHLHLSRHAAVWHCAVWHVSGNTTRWRGLTVVICDWKKMYFYCLLYFTFYFQNESRTWMQVKVLYHLQKGIFSLVLTLFFFNPMPTHCDALFWSDHWQGLVFWNWFRLFLLLHKFKKVWIIILKPVWWNIIKHFYVIKMHCT